MEKSRELAMTQMRKSVEKLGFSTEKYGDRTPMRFLIARSMDAEKASKMFVQWLKWRSSFVPNGFIAESEVPDQLEARKLFCKVHQRQDIQWSYQSMQPFSSQGPSPVQDSVKGREIGDEKLIGILDLQQVTNKNVDARGLITGFQFLQAYFPERLAKCYILHMPRFFVSMWRMVSHFIEKATLEKIAIVTNDDEKKSFIEEIGKEVVPIEYGGKAKMTAIQDVEVPPLEG